MRVIVCGSRDWHDVDAIRRALARLPFPHETVIVHGDARGADKQAGEIARTMGFRVEAHPAEWSKWGRIAGPKRNQKMLDLGADLVLAFQLNASTGTNDMILKAARAGVPVEIDSRWEERRGR